MTPERMAGFVTRWVQYYTRRLPAPVAERRVEEIEADLHDHIAYERAAGTSDSQIARAVASRMIRGLAADLAWRTRQTTSSKPFRRSAVRIGLGVAIVLSLPLVAMQFSEDVVWSLADFVAAGVLLATVGVTLELAVGKAGNLVAAGAIAALGIAAAVLGEADDAPGLVLLGILLVAGACAVGVRRLQHGR